MATLKQCDRCGKIESPIYFMRYQIGRKIRSEDDSFFSERELCADCKNELIAFMRGEQIGHVVELDFQLEGEALVKLAKDCTDMLMKRRDTYVCVF